MIKDELEVIFNYYKTYVAISCCKKSCWQKIVPVATPVIILDFLIEQNRICGARGASRGYRDEFEEVRDCGTVYFFSGRIKLERS
jgi:hypothetical protein